MEFQKTNQISVKDYFHLRELVGWGNFPEEEAQAGLDHSAYIVCYKDGEKTIATARLVWDFGYIAFICDVIVHPDYQKKGLGKKLMNDILDFIKENIKEGYRVKVNLMSSKGKEEFYKKFGFSVRPNDYFGCGMDMWLVK